jgi:hypothetical protein
MDLIKKLWWLWVVLGYLGIGAVIALFVVVGGDYPHPAARFLITMVGWPIPVIRALFGGGPL